VSIIQESNRFSSAKAKMKMTKFQYLVAFATLVVGQAQVNINIIDADMEEGDMAGDAMESFIEEETLLNMTLDGMGNITNLTEYCLELYANDANATLAFTGFGLDPDVAAVTKQMMPMPDPIANMTDGNMTDPCAFLFANTTNVTEAPSAAPSATSTTTAPAPASTPATPASGGSSGGDEDDDDDDDDDVGDDGLETAAPTEDDEPDVGSLSPTGPGLDTTSPTSTMPSATPSSAPTASPACSFCSDGEEATGGDKLFVGSDGTTTCNDQIALLEQDPTLCETFDYVISGVDIAVYCECPGAEEPGACAGLCPEGSLLINEDTVVGELPCSVWNDWATAALEPSTCDSLVEQRAACCSVPGSEENPDTAGDERY
jgi:hypothetical protein